MWVAREGPLGQQSGVVSDIEVLSTVRRREMAGQPEMPKASKASLVCLTLPGPSQVHWRLLPARDPGTGLPKFRPHEAAQRLSVAGSTEPRALHRQGTAPARRFPSSSQRAWACLSPSRPPEPPAPAPGQASPFTSQGPWGWAGLSFLCHSGPSNPAWHERVHW